MVRVRKSAADRPRNKTNDSSPKKSVLLYCRYQQRGRYKSDGERIFNRAKEMYPAGAEWVLWWQQENHVIAFWIPFKKRLAKMQINKQGPSETAAKVLLNYRRPCWTKRSAWIDRLFLRDWRLYLCNLPWLWGVRCNIYFGRERHRTEAGIESWWASHQKSGSEFWGSREGDRGLNVKSDVIY